MGTRHLPNTLSILAASVGHDVGDSNALQARNELRFRLGERAGDGAIDGLLEHAGRTLVAMAESERRSAPSA